MGASIFRKPINDCFCRSIVECLDKIVQHYTFIFKANLGNCQKSLQKCILSSYPAMNILPTLGLKNKSLKLALVRKICFIRWEWTLGCVPKNFWYFQNIFSFSMVLSLTLSCISWGNLYKAFPLLDFRLLFVFCLWWMEPEKHLVEILKNNS